jgi:nicotinamide mononucleotide transporter
LIADGVLQVFYIVIGFVGLYQWVVGQKNNQPKNVIQSSWKQHVLAIILCLLFSIPFSWWLIEHAGARYGYLDTALTLLSVYATILLVRKDLHNWIYWIVIDVVYVGLYLKSDGLLFALLYFVYAAVAVWGFRQWRSHAKK